MKTLKTLFKIPFDKKIYLLESVMEAVKLFSEMTNSEIVKTILIQRMRK